MSLARPSKRTNAPPSLTRTTHPHSSPSATSISNRATKTRLGRPISDLSRCVRNRATDISGWLRSPLTDTEYDAAIDLLSDAISRDPQDFRAHNLLGQTYQQLGQTQKARYHLAIVKSLDRRDQLSKHVVFDDPLYHKMLASNTTDAALTERMRAAMGTGQPEVAIRLAEELCRRHPDDAVRMNSLAVACKQAKRYTDALDRAEKAISLDSGFLEAHVTKAQLLMILRRNSEALELLDWIVGAGSGFFRRSLLSRCCPGAVRAVRGRPLSRFARPSGCRTDSARAHVALAEALGETDRQAEAIEEYRRALELDPSNARARQRLLESEHVNGGIVPYLPEGRLGRPRGKPGVRS